MTKFLDIFQPIEKGNFGLTDEAIYRSIQRGGDFVPVWGAYKQHIYPDRFIPESGRTKYNEPITVYDGQGIIINFDGVSAGRMTYKNNERFAINHHAGFFRVKKEAVGLISPEFFALFYQNQLHEASVSSDQNTLTVDMIYSIDFDIPAYETQEKIMSMVRPLLLRKEKIKKLLVELESVKSRTIYHEYSHLQVQDVPISKVLDYVGGNSGLTEQEIYNKIQMDGERYIVLSGSTQQENNLGEVPMCTIDGKPLKVFINREGILIVRKGKAGTTFFLDKGRKYAINDDAYILFLRDDFTHKVSLKWIMIQYRNTFFEYSSSSDNGTWNMGGFFDKVSINIPEYVEQMQVLGIYEKLERYEAQLRILLEKIERIFAKQII